MQRIHRLVLTVVALLEGAEVHGHGCRRAEELRDTHRVAGGGVARSHRPARAGRRDRKDGEANVREALANEREELAEPGVAGEVDGA